MCTTHCLHTIQMTSSTFDDAVASVLALHAAAGLSVMHDYGLQRFKQRKDGYYISFLAALTF